MEFPRDYDLALNDHEVSRHFPQLQNNLNFWFTSLRTEDYNCIAWAQEITDDWLQLTDGRNLVYEIDKYIEYFKSLGFLECDKKEIIDLDKETKVIAVYYSSSNRAFTHVARRLENGNWASKLGDWEDIEHNVPEVLLGSSYGDSVVYLKK